MKLSARKIPDNVRNGVLQKYGRAVVHMRQQDEDRRLGLILGAGASTDFGFPTWKELIERIASHPEVRAQRLLTHSEKHTSRSQLLFQRYKHLHAASDDGSDHQFNKHEVRIKAGWQKIVRDCLYKGVPESIATLRRRDQYLWAYLDLIRNSRLTVTYNFDDTLQRLLAATRSGIQKEKTRGYETVWNANVQMSPKGGVIYHPNGFLPRKKGSQTSEHLVFLEDSFADQLIDSMSGHYSSLSHHLAQTTCLLLGLSLEDATLKHLLRQNAKLFPGHYHYYVAFVEDGKKPDPQFEQSVSNSNFEVYNLITLFLNRQEMAALGVLLSMPDDDFCHLAEELGQPRAYRFILTGSVGVGKTTGISQFRSLRAHDEWLEPLHPGMEKDPSSLKPRETDEIDAWVMRQLGLKNLVMLEARQGVHIVDRAPLDAFAFTPKPEWKKKATMIKRAISPGKSMRTLCPAHIILMLGDPEVMAVRCIARHRQSSAASLTKQQDLLYRVYGERVDGVSVVDTREKSISQVAKEIAHIIHRKPYSEGNLQEWLDGCERGDINARSVKPSPASN